jgi:hypothetical protein
MTEPKTIARQPNQQHSDLVTAAMALRRSRFSLNVFLGRAHFGFFE